MEINAVKEGKTITTTKKKKYSNNTIYVREPAKLKVVDDNTLDEYMKSEYPELIKIIEDFKLFLNIIIYAVSMKYPQFRYLYRYNHNTKLYIITIQLLHIICNALYVE